jgi:hypothetical protein
VLALATGSSLTRWSVTKLKMAIAGHSGPGFTLAALSLKRPGH